MAVVGDSLAVGVERFGSPAETFAERGCELTRIDAVGGRPVAGAAAIVENWAQTGQLPDVVVVIAGTNNCTYESMAGGVDRVLTAVGTDREIVWQNTYRAGCDTAVNAALNDRVAADAARHGRNRVRIVDHHGNVESNPSLVSDGIHMGPQGYRDSTRALAAAVAAVHTD